MQYSLFVWLKTFLFICLFSGSLNLSAQQLPLHSFPVEVDGQQLKNPWAGGLKSPQFSAADLNNDGVEDLFIFDKTGDVILGFRNDGTADEPDYHYSPSLVRNFPVLEDWAMMRDFDNDGAPDIFGQLIESAIQGIAVWKGKWVNNKLQFDRILFPQLTVDAIPVATGSGDFTQIFVSTQDIPAIVDYDDDGDLDILTFSMVGGVVYYYLNMDVENGNDLETFEYKRIDDCWGRFFESGIVGCLDLSDDPEMCSEGLLVESGVHAGSTIAVFDGDGDGDKDMVLGDISFSNLIFAENTPTNGHSYVTDQDCDFPNYDIPLNLVAFPAAYMLDLNNDGRRDMVVSPNTSTSGEDRNSVWFYRNRGTDLSPEFRMENQQFMIDEMIDVGNGANPAFLDYNADGLLDLIVGNNSFWISGGDKDSRLQLYVNIGTSTEPFFKLQDDDFLGFRDLFLTASNIYNFTPTVADMDGDDDMDLIIGDNSGRLIYCENTAGPNATMTFGSPQYGWMDIKVGKLSTPDVVDINRDGLLDIVIGESTVNAIDYTDTLSSFNLFINTGTVNSPMFDPNPDATPNTQYFGFASTADDGFNAGESAPRFYDLGNEFLLFSGSSSGKVKVFSNIEGNLDGKFDRIYNDYGNLKSGWTTRLDIADINGDEVLDMVVGNRRGGFQFVETNYKTDGTTKTNNTVAENIEFSLYPNPASSIINVELPQRISQGFLQVFNSNGQLLHTQKVNNRKTQIEVDRFGAGIYFVKYEDEKGVFGVKRVVVF